MDINDNSKYYSRFHIRDQNISGTGPYRIKENNRYINYDFRKNKYNYEKSVPFPLYRFRDTQVNFIPTHNNLDHRVNIIRSENYFISSQNYEGRGPRVETEFLRSSEQAKIEGSGVLHYQNSSINNNIYLSPPPGIDIQNTYRSEQDYRIRGPDYRIQGLDYRNTSTWTREENIPLNEKQNNESRDLNTEESKVYSLKGNTLETQNNELKTTLKKLLDIDITIKRGSYILAIISVENFVKKGAQKLDCGIFWIKKEYNGTPTNETCALIGVKIKDIFNFLVDNSQFMNSIKNDPNLQYIQLIDKLTCKFVQNTISKFRHYLHDLSISEDLALFNIEPKGDGKLERCYPIPRISIPGGKMEEGDLFDFEKCALREFKEETGIDISFCHRKLSREKIKRGFRFNHFTGPEDRITGPDVRITDNKESFIIQNFRKEQIHSDDHLSTKVKSYYSKNKENRNQKDTKYISMYYLVRID